MKNKKSIMAFAGILIIIFHLWILPPGKIGIEAFIKQTAYIGVDIFFLLSAYSLSCRNVEGYGSFVFSRFMTVYFRFILFAVFTFFYEGWKPVYLFKVITGIDLLERGGGAFLWFVPAIMLFYLVFPFLQKYDKKNRFATLLIIILVWSGTGLLVTKFTQYKQMFIFWNRIPIFLIGYYLGVYKDRIANSKHKLFFGITLSVVGIYLLYIFAYNFKLNAPIADMFYATVIPAGVGLSMLVDFVPEFKPVKWLGSSTLEMYALQMIFGYTVANKLLIMTKNIILTNIITVLFVLILATVIHYIYDAIYKKIINS